MPAADSHRKIEWCHAIQKFLNQIGIKAQAVPASPDLAGSFNPHVRISNGAVEYDIERVFPGDILHEAGHIAVMPAQFRHLASGNLYAAFAAMRQYQIANPNGIGTYPEDPILRGTLQCSDTEATAWQYAAAVEIGLPDELLFPEGSFDGNAEENLLRLKGMSHYGINGLRAAGWTSMHKFGQSNPLIPPVYPKLAFWLHPDTMATPTVM